MQRVFSRSLFLGTVILMDALVGAEFDLFIPSFPELQEHFQISPFWVEALLSVNFIGYCLSLFVVGSLADRYGRKPIIIAGLLIFMGGSLLCLGGIWYPLLLVGRFFQGIGIASPAILSFLLVADAYSLKEQRFLLALLNGFMHFAIGAAPVAGSYITLAFHWQGNFMALLLLAGFTLGMTLLFVPEEKVVRPKERISLEEYSSLMRSRPLRLVILHFVVQFVPYWIFVGMTSLLYMTDLGVPLVQFGYYQGAIALVFGLGSLLSGFIVRDENQRTFLIVSLQIFTLSLLSIGCASFIGDASPLFITLAFLPFVVAQITPSVILYPLVLSLNPEAKGRISSLMQGGRLILSALCLEIAGYFYEGSFLNIGLLILIFVILSIYTLYLILQNDVLSEALGRRDKA